MALHFSQPNSLFGGIDAETVGDLIAASCDLALVVNDSDIVLDIACAADTLIDLDVANWRGTPIVESVEYDCRQKVLAMLSAARSGAPTASCEVLHPTKAGSALKVRYFARQSGAGGHIVLLGRNLTPLANLQDRLLAAQQSLEMNYERHRQSEARYRLLFEIASEPFLIVRSRTMQVLEASRRAAELFGISVAETIGRDFVSLFGPAGDGPISDALAEASVSKKQIKVTVDNVGADGASVGMTISARGSDDDAVFLVSLSPTDIPAASAEEANLMDLFRLAGEGIVLTDQDGTILWVNDAFLELSQHREAGHIIGRSLSRFFDRDEFDLDVVLASVRRHKRLRLVSAAMRSATRQIEQVELSVVAMPEATFGGFGIVIRSVSLRRAVEENDRSPRQPVEHFIAKVGKVPLKTLVRESKDSIEKHCIEAALKLTGDNRAHTAKVLGLSRQSLYNKMRRFGLVTAEDDEAESNGATLAALPD